MITYYTDGSCQPNPGPGGFAVIRNMKPHIIGGDRESTNIRMECRAIISAILDAEDEICRIYTDSEFWINVITKWSIGWEKNGWTKKNGEIKNLDLVKHVCEVYRASKAELVWVRGHNNDPGNELADVWANKAREKVKAGEIQPEAPLLLKHSL